MKSMLRQFALATVVLAIFGCLVSCAPPAKNDGRESAYYGDFNRVSNALVSIPGVTVTNFWINRDITLEEFAFDITTTTGEAVHLGIGERDPLRKMLRQELVEALKREIAQKLSSTNK
jgi:hypothetical protein